MRRASSCLKAGRCPAMRKPTSKNSYEGPASEPGSMSPTESHRRSGSGLIRQPQGAEVTKHPVRVGAFGDLSQGKALITLGSQECEQLAPGIGLVREVVEMNLVDFGC